MGVEDLRGEAWAKAQIGQDQSIQFPADWPEADRRVSGAFVVDAILDARWATVPEGFFLANAIVTTPVERRYAHIQGELTFQDCTFAADLRLPYATFERRVRFMGGALEGGFDINCCRAADLEFGESPESGPTVFHGPVNFGGATIGGQLLCTKAQFLSETGPASFNSCKVTGLARFVEAIFCGPVNFGSATIGGHLDCTKARFFSETGPANFNSCNVTYATFLQEAIFCGLVDFGSATIGGQLLCAKAQFLSETGPASFNSCKVTGLARFVEAIFCGPVNFGSATIGGQLDCAKAQFLSKAGTVTFHGCSVQGEAFFKEAAFHGPVGLNFCKLSTLWLAGAQFSESLDFSHTAIAGALYVLSPTTEVSEGSKKDTKFPPTADLRALTYDRTDLELADHWKAWIGLRRKSDTYDPGPFFTLERSFRRAGRDDLADKVHYAMRRAEAHQLFRQRRIDKAAWNWFLRGAVGYGVYGYFLILWALGLLGASYLAIRWAHAAGLIIQVTPGKPVPDFSPFLYMVSLLLFNVAAFEKQYQPAGEWAFVEVAIHLCAWILVPLAIAQLGGFVKKKE